MTAATINPRRAWHGALVPAWLLWRTDVSMGAKLVYARLARYADAHGVAYPTVATLAAEVGLKERQTRVLVAELKEHGLIRQELDPARRAAARYTFLAHPWMEARRPAGSCPSDHEDTGPAEGQTGRGADRQDPAPQTGTPPPVTPAESRPSDRQDPAPKESQGRESPEESHRRTLFPVVATADRPKRARARPADALPALPFRAHRACELVHTAAPARFPAVEPRDVAAGQAIAIERHVRAYPTEAEWSRLGAWLAAGGLGYRTDLGVGWLAKCAPDAMAQARTWDASGRAAVVAVAAPRAPPPPAVRTGYMPAATRAQFEASIAAKKAATR